MEGANAPTLEFGPGPARDVISVDVSRSGDELISGPHRMVARVVGRVDNYRIIDELGSGGMAVVYRAEDERLRRQVALKILHDHIAGRPENRERFEREARAVARLEHPNIMSVYGFSSPTAPVGYIAAELIDGQTLRAFVDRRGFRFPEVAAMVCQPLADALAHAHEQGIIHRDFKPENVMISRAGVPKLMDFGLARLLDHQTLTMTGAVLGSPAHMSPEAIEGHPVDERVDIFAFGTVLYYAVTGRLPFDGRNPAVILNAILTGRYADPTIVNPRVSGPLGRIIGRCLESRPQDRYQSARELAGDLRSWLHELGLDDPASELRAFFAAPDAYEAEFEVRLVAKLQSLAEDSLHSGRTAAALGHCDHILAIRPDHAPALTILGRVERRRRIRSAVAVGAGLAALFVVGTLLLGPGLRLGGPGSAEMRATEAGTVTADAVAEHAGGVGHEIRAERLHAEAETLVALALDDAKARVAAGTVADRVRLRAERIAFFRAATNAARITDRLRPSAAELDVDRGTDPETVDTAVEGSGDTVEVAAIETVRVFLRVRPHVTVVRVDGEERGIAVDVERTGIELPIGRHQLDMKIPNLQGGERRTWIDVRPDGPREFDFRVEWPPAVVTFEASERGHVLFEGQPYSTDERLIVPILEDGPNRDIELIFVPRTGEPVRRTVTVRTERETRVVAPF